MSEHIKTGAEIGHDVFNPVNRDVKGYVSGDEKWVSLPWLKEQIDKQTNDIADKPISVYDTGAWDMLRWFSKLLEDEVKQK